MAWYPNWPYLQYHQLELAACAWHISVHCIADYMKFLRAQNDQSCSDALRMVGMEGRVKWDGELVVKDTEGN